MKTKKGTTKRTHTKYGRPSGYQLKPSGLLPKARQYWRVNEIMAIRDKVLPFIRIKESFDIDLNNDVIKEGDLYLFVKTHNRRAWMTGLRKALPKFDIHHIRDDVPDGDAFLAIRLTEK